MLPQKAGTETLGPGQTKEKEASALLFGILDSSYIPHPQFCCAWMVFGTGAARARLHTLIQTWFGRIRRLTYLLHCTEQPVLGPQMYPRLARHDGAGEKTRKG